MVFVMRTSCDFLPRELARLHATGLGLTMEDALAPWAIDNATDELYARRVQPADLFWLAADNVNALFWGLHDWSHFHHHGPFVERAWTELQCDVTALAWLWLNRAMVPLSERTWERLRREAAALSHSRFADEGRALDEMLFDRDRVRSVAARTARNPCHAAVDACVTAPAVGLEKPEACPVPSDGGTKGISRRSELT
jgi:hypothetical protein